MFKNSWLHVFIDESGSVSLNYGKDESPLYVCVAVIVSDAQKNALESGLDSIAKELRQGAVIKHVNIGKDHAARTEILAAIGKLDFKYIALVVNKSELNNYPGLSFKRSFYKYINKKLYSFIGENAYYDYITINTDGHGNKEFQDSCLAYFEREVESLFPKAELNFKNDKDYRMIQLADMIAGTLNYCFIKYRDTPEAATWKTYLEPKAINIDVFPISYSSSSETALTKTDDELANKLFKLLYRNAENFIIKNRCSNDEIIEMQTLVLQHLIFVSKYETERYICADKLIDIIKNKYDFDINKQSFTSKIIGGLRNRKIIISGSSKGYKLALSVDDIQEYLGHNKSIIEPMLYRLKLAKDMILTSLQYDILDSPQYSILWKFISDLGNSKLESIMTFDEESSTLSDDDFATVNTTSE